MIKTEWKAMLEYSSKEIVLTDDKVVMKHTFDPSKNPGISRVSFEDFLTGRYKNEIVWDFGGTAYQEIINSIHDKLTSYENYERE